MKKKTALITSCLLTMTIFSVVFTQFGKDKYNVLRKPASKYEFGGTCSMQGAWTSQALSTANSIRTELMKLKDDPDCSGLYTAFSGIEMPTNEKDLGSMDERDNVNGAVSALSHVMETGEASPGVLTSMLGNVLDRASLNAKNPNIPVGRVISVGLDSLSSLFDELPNATACLHSRPALGGVLMGGAARMLSAYSASGQTNMSGLGGVIEKFTKLLRDQKFMNTITQLDEAQFVSSISCILESAAENYCSVKDAYKLLEHANEESNVYKKNKKIDIEYNPLEGYFIVTRETPIISEWIQKVMFGVSPRTNADSNQKNQVIQNVNGFLQAENSLIGALQERILNYQSSSQTASEEAKKNHIFKTITDIMDDIEGNKYGGDGKINFFTETKAPMKIAFELIGINRVPEIVAMGNPDKGTPPMKWEIYMSNGGQFIQAFDDPDLLLSQISTRLEGFINEAKMNASSYFRERLIVDKQNLVDKSLVSQTVSVHESFLRIENYLSKLITRSLGSDKAQDRLLATSMVKTRENVRNVLAAYKKLDEKIKSSIAGVNDVDATAKRLEDDDDINEYILEIISTVYTEFNVILQRDTFLMNRMDAYVRYDYMYYTKNSETLSDYEKDLLIVAGKNIIDILGTAYQDNPALIKQDLANAQTINIQNIKALEEAFRDKLFIIISRLKLIADGKGDGWFKQAFHADGRWWRDSMNDFDIKYKSMKKDDGWVSYIYDNVHVANPLILGWRYLKNGDRYTVSGKMFEKAIIEGDDEEGSFEQLKSKICFQTLPFTKYFQYHYLCEDSVLNGLDKEELSLVYDELYQDYVKLDLKRKDLNEKENLKLKERFSKNVCALRDFRRKNYAYWLVKQINVD